MKLHHRMLRHFIARKCHCADIFLPYFELVASDRAMSAYLRLYRAESRLLLSL